MSVDKHSPTSAISSWYACRHLKTFELGDDSAVIVLFGIFQAENVQGRHQGKTKKNTVVHCSIPSETLLFTDQCRSLTAILFTCLNSFCLSDLLFNGIFRDAQAAKAVKRALVSSGEFGLKNFERSRTATRSPALLRRGSAYRTLIPIVWSLNFAKYREKAWST